MKQFFKIKHKFHPNSHMRPHNRPTPKTPVSLRSLQTTRSLPAKIYPPQPTSHTRDKRQRVRHGPLSPRRVLDACHGGRLLACARAAFGELQRIFFFWFSGVLFCGNIELSPMQVFLFIGASKTLCGITTSHMANVASNPIQWGKSRPASHRLQPLTCSSLSSSHCVPFPSLFLSSCAETCMGLVSRIREAGSNHHHLGFDGQRTRYFFFENVQ